MKNRSRADLPLVVIVDDDRSVRLSWGRLLRAAGLDVKLFASAAELLAFEWPDRAFCLVVDLHLPDMEGLELLRRSKERDPELPVIVVTGDLAPELRVRALQGGAAAFLLKPSEDRALLREIGRALGVGPSQFPPFQGPA
jgi:FixJ family two-component response regulator